MDSAKPTDVTKTIISNIANNEHRKCWQSIVGDLCRIDHMLAHADMPSKPALLQLFARVLNKWRHLPEHLQHHATSIIDKLVMDGFVYAATLGKQFQIRYSLHHNRIWQKRCELCGPSLSLLARIEPGCLIYGAGTIGSVLAVWLQRHGVNVNAYLDAYQMAKEIDGIPVIRPENADKHLKELPVILSLADSGRVVYRNLEYVGFSRIMRREDLFEHV